MARVPVATRGRRARERVRARGRPGATPPRSLAEILRKSGVEVDEVVCYDTIATPQGRRALSQALMDVELSVTAEASDPSLEARPIAAGHLALDSLSHA